jgi:N6-adenosine-specific RNA methylase IME4
MSKKFELAGQLDLFTESVCEGKRSDQNWAFAPLQRGAYGAIAADPPSSFATWSKAGQGKSASQHYSVMSLDDIKALPVAHLAAADCFLLLWATQAQLHQALSVMQCWGFQFKTTGTWA